MARKSIAIDIDDVLVDHAEAFVEFSNKNYGTNFKIEDYDDAWGNIWCVDEKEIDKRKDEFHKPSSILSFGIKPTAKPTLEKLAKNYNLYIVTARPEPLIELTRDWIKKHFEGIFTDVHFVPIWKPDNKVTKADICNQIGAEFLIDDLAMHCNIAAKGGIQAILFGDFGWNRDENIVEGVIRCKDWQEVADFLERE